MPGVLETLTFSYYSILIDLIVNNHLCGPTVLDSTEGTCLQKALDVG